MDAIIVIFSCALAVILSLCVRRTKLPFITGRKKKWNLPPSPASLPVIGHLHHLKKPLHQSLARLAARHGPLLLLRFGTRPVLVVSSASLAEECFTANDIAFANRPKLPSNHLTSYNYTTLALASYGPEWRDMRRIATIEALSGHRLAFFADIRADEARDLARRLFRDLARHGDGQDFTRVELRPRLFGLSMNVILRMTAGKRIYGEENGDGEARRFEEVVQELFSLLGASNVGDFLPSAIGWIARRRVKERLSRVHNFRDRFLQTLIERRRKERAEEKRSHETMLDALLSLQEGTPEQYTDRFIKALFTSLLSAGTDTSSNNVCHDTSSALGKLSFPIREVGLVLGMLIQGFEWRRIGMDEVDMTQGSGLTLPRAIPLDALCKPREAMISVLSQL